MHMTKTPISILFSAALAMTAGCGPGGGADAGRDAPLPDVPMAPTDAGPDGGPPPCVTDAECDDGLFCNGAEACRRGAPGADFRGCVAEPPCAAGTCDEATDRCSACAADDDGDDDGAVAVSCGGDDCDDMDPMIRPGQLEVCDDVDQDCDRVVDDVPSSDLPSWFRDIDEDGYGVTGDVAEGCDPPAPTGWASRGGDCDDNLRSVSPGSTEVPGNMLDDDCNGRIDDRGRAVLGGRISTLGEVSGGAAGRVRILEPRLEGASRVCGSPGASPVRCVTGGLTP
jgi:hypothetical protein